MKHDLLRVVAARIKTGEAIAVVTDLASGRQSIVDRASQSGEVTLTDPEIAEVRRLMVADRSAMIEGTQYFVRVYAQPARMVVVGAVHIAQALVPMARLAGFAVTVIDPRAAFIKSSGFDGVEAIEAWPDEAMGRLTLDSRTAVVTLTHDPKLDDPALTAALKSAAFYIGALGSRKTHAKRLERLKDAGFSDADFVRIHGPVGLDINAETPAEIAVSIMADVIQVLRRDVE